MIKDKDEKIIIKNNENVKVHTNNDHSILTYCTFITNHHLLHLLESYYFHTKVISKEVTYVQTNIYLTWNGNGEVKEDVLLIPKDKEPIKAFVLTKGDKNTTEQRFFSFDRFTDEIKNDTEYKIIYNMQGCGKMKINFTTSNNTNYDEFVKKIHDGEEYYYLDFIVEEPRYVFMTKDKCDVKKYL